MFIIFKHLKSNLNILTRYYDVKIEFYFNTQNRKQVSQ
jgi:hypothetical protein